MLGDNISVFLFFWCVFVGLRESMRQAELNNWSLEPTQIADLCSSINQFFARTGVIQQQGPVQPPVCHGPMHPNKPSQHLNTGETSQHSQSCSIAPACLYRWSYAAILWFQQPQTVHVCLSSTFPGVKIADCLLTGFLVSHIQEISTLTPDRACPWWARRDTPTCPPWTPLVPQWQVTPSHLHPERLTLSIGSGAVVNLLLKEKEKKKNIFFVFFYALAKTKSLIYVVYCTHHLKIQMQFTKKPPVSSELWSRY